MKTPIIAAMLLVLAAPALASSRTPTPAQWKVIHKYSEAALYCTNHRTGEESGEIGETKKQCEVEIKLGNKLKARGFCLYAKSGVGRTGKPWTQKEDWESWQRGQRHCHAIHDPSVPSRFHQN